MSLYYSWLAWFGLELLLKLNMNLPGYKLKTAFCNSPQLIIDVLVNMLIFCLNNIRLVVLVLVLKIVVEY